MVGTTELDSRTQVWAIFSPVGGGEQVHPFDRHGGPRLLVYYQDKAASLDEQDMERLPERRGVDLNSQHRYINTKEIENLIKSISFVGLYYICSIFQPDRRVDVN